MSWNPNDLVADDDLLAYEPTILTQFAVTGWQDKRAKALEDWLFPALVSRGYDPDRLRTRHAPAALVGYTGSTYTPLDGSTNVAVGSILTGTSDALYVGHDRPFRGLSLRVEDAPSSATATARVALWLDTWAVRDVAPPWGVGPAFSRGGALTWEVPGDWVPRVVSTGPARYWARVTVTAALTANAVLPQVAVIRRSLFSGPVTMQTLALIFRAAPTSSDGPWDTRADWYANQAELGLQRALSHAGGEFDLNPEDDVLDATEATQTADEAGAGPWVWERA